MKKNRCKSSLFIAFLFTITVFTISCGGGGGGGGSSSSDGTSSLINSQDPWPGETNVKEDVIVSVEFTQKMDSASVEDTFLMWDSSGQPVSGFVFYEDPNLNDHWWPVAVFVPDDPLMPSTVYTVQINAKTSSGVPMSSPYTWKFTTRADPGIGVWKPMSTINGPSANWGFTATWTGTELIIWGGRITSNAVTSDGGRYNPVTDTWKTMSVTGAPAARAYHTAVWTGSEMIIWGGVDAADNVFGDGGRYNPVTDTWKTMSVTGAPAARAYHTAVWTGSEMIIWGGMNATGGRYNPVTNSWTSMSVAGAPAARTSHTAVWTGSEMIIWGGFAYSDALADGAIYNPSSDSWKTTTSNGAPEARYFHSAVWTGTEMIIWGGEAYKSVYSHENMLNNGGRYNPATDTWVSTTINGAPEARFYHSAVWTGTEMIIWGGDTYIYTMMGYWWSGISTGGRYNPLSNTWIATAVKNAPARAYGTRSGVWTGSEMLIWGPGLGAYYQP